MLLSYSVRVGSSIENKILGSIKESQRNSVGLFLSSRKTWKKEQDNIDIKYAPRTMLTKVNGKLVKSKSQPFLTKIG